MITSRWPGWKEGLIEWGSCQSYIYIAMQHRSNIWRILHRQVSPIFNSYFISVNKVGTSLPNHAGG